MVKKNGRKMNVNPEKSLTVSLENFLEALSMWQPQNDSVIASPEKSEAGYWIGCPGIFQDGGKTFLTLRKRRPRNMGAERGWYCGIFELSTGTAGYKMNEVWSVHKDELNTASMERFALHKTQLGYEIYISYVDPLDNRWRIDVVRAETLQSFDIQNKKPVLTAESTGTEGVKDPFIFVEGDREWMFVSAAQSGEIHDNSAAHDTKDIFNTKYAKSVTGIATRLQGSSHWEWRDFVLTPDENSTWDANTRRINSVIALTDVYLAFYDGKDSFENNYEEQTGIAVSHNLQSWDVLTPIEPIISSDAPAGSLRYVDYRVMNGKLDVIYESSRPDGSHDMRIHQFKI